MDELLLAIIASYLIDYLDEIRYIYVTLKVHKKYGLEKICQIGLWFHDVLT